MKCVLAAFILSLCSLTAQVFSPELIGALGSAPSVFNPSNVPGILLWLQADTYSNSANGTQIQLWEDISGNGNHFTNETLARSPYVTNNVINGHSAIRFPGTTIDFRWMSNALGFASSLTQAEMFAVLRGAVSPGIATVTVPWNFKPAGAAEAAHPNTASQIQPIWGQNITIGYNANVTNDYSNTGVVTNFHYFNNSIQTNDFLARFNGDPVLGIDTLATSSIGFSNITWLGRSADNGMTWNGSIAELMMFNRVLSAANRSNIYVYLSNRYAIAYTNPAVTVSPTDYLASAVGWWRADDVSTNDGSQITYWPDISGNNRHLTNSTGQPKYRANFLGTHAAIEWNGTTNNWKLWPPADINMTNQITMILVHKIRSNTRVAWSKQSGNYQYRYREGGNNAMLFFLGGPSASSGTGPQPVGDIRMDVIQRDSANNITFWQNLTNATPGNVSAVARIEVMGGQVGDNTISYDGYMFEALIFTNAFKQNTLVKLYETYFKPRYGLP